MAQSAVTLKVSPRELQVIVGALGIAKEVTRRASFGTVKFATEPDLDIRNFMTGQAQYLIVEFTSLLEHIGMR